MWLFIEHQRGSVFLYACLCGFVIGGFYDVFRVIRCLFIGGRLRLFFEDIVFCTISTLAFLVFCFNVSMGVVRMFLVFGVLVGFFAYRYTLGVLTVFAATALKSALRPYVLSIKKVIIIKFKAFCSVKYTHTTINKIKHLSGKGFV